jgi:hypothetical protein
MSDKNTLTNQELADKLMYWAKRLASSGGKDWTLRVPADENHDPDCIMAEAAKRLAQIAEVTIEDVEIRCNSCDTVVATVMARKM